jgi:hypothetical protein
MRPVRYVFGLLVSVAIGTTGCGGSGDDTGTDPGGGGNPTIVTPSAAEKNAVSAGLSALATQVGQSDVVAQQLLNALALVMQTTTTATEMDVTTNLDVLGDFPGSAASFSASASSAMVTRRVLGYSITFNLQPGQRTTRGVIVWDGAGTKVMVTVFGNAEHSERGLPVVRQRGLSGQQPDAGVGGHEGQRQLDGLPWRHRAMHGHNATMLARAVMRLGGRHLPCPHPSRCLSMAIPRRARGRRC